MSMITELIEKLREVAKKYYDNNGSNEYEVFKYLHEAADTIEELSAKLYAANMERSSQYYHGGWIPCSVRLPKPQEFGNEDFSEWVQITLHIGKDNDVVGRAYYCFSKKKWYTDRLGLGKVTAWMPLPQSYLPNEEVEIFHKDNEE